MSMGSKFYNNVVRIEDTALKWSFIMNVGCINKIEFLGV